MKNTGDDSRPKWNCEACSKEFGGPCTIESGNIERPAGCLFGAAGQDTDWRKVETPAAKIMMEDEIPVVHITISEDAIRQLDIKIREGT